MLVEHNRTDSKSDEPEGGGEETEEVDWWGGW